MKNHHTIHPWKSTYLQPASTLSAAALILMSILLNLLIAACSAVGEEAIQEEGKPEESAMTIQVSSAAFNDGEPIPSKFTCDGEDISPPISWTDLSEDTVSAALIMDDPDAPSGTWVHWVIYDMPAGTTRLDENIPASGELQGGGKQGNNSGRRSGYSGPCPPSGTHRYFFKLYALDTSLNLEAGITKAELLQAMEGHILAQGQLMGTYARK